MSQMSKFSDDYDDNGRFFELQRRLRSYSALSDDNGRLNCTKCVFGTFLVCNVSNVKIQ